MNTETHLCMDNIKIVMDGLESIKYNKESLEQSTISLFKTSYNGMKFIKDDPMLFHQAIGMWLNIIENQLLNISKDDYVLLETKSAPIKGMEWLGTLCAIKKEYLLIA